MLARLLPFAVVALLQPSRVISQNPDAEVVILKYKILSPDEARFFSNAHYAFEVCICNRPSRDPKLSQACTCADLKGRTVRYSKEPVDYSDDCSPSKISYRCLVASLPYFDSDPPIYYIRVSANGYVLSRPGWQEMTQGDEESTTASFGSRGHNPIELTFVIKEHLQTWANTFRKTVKKPHTHVLFKSTTTSTTTTTPTTTTTSEEWSTTNDVDQNGLEEQNDYLRYAGITNMYQLRSFLMTESVKDRVAPYNLDIEEYKRQIIIHHNELRALHGSPPLEYDAYVEADAQRWANYLGGRESCVAHDPNRRLGECLFYFGGLILPREQTLAALTVQSFYLENSNYDYNNYRAVYFYRTGHFTQMIWKSSRRVGVGVSLRLTSGGGLPCRPYFPSYQLYVVVKYDPPGNVQNSYAYSMNVQPRMR